MGAAPDRAIVGRSLDLALTGGVAIVAIIALLLLPLPSLSRLGAAWTLVLQSVINWPHFMGSYALLYSSRESIAKHRFAALYFPAGLAAYTTFAFVAWQWQPIHVTLLQWGATLYLGRHYTGQTWGMMASFGYVEGVTFAPRERWLIRAGLNLMMLWQMSWAAAALSPYLSPSLTDTLVMIYDRMLPVAIVAVVLGAGGLAVMGLRLRAIPPIRILVPWVSLHFWYLLLAMDSGAVLIVQLAHGLQYLAFPLRIETNRAERPLGQIAPRRLILWIASGFVVFAGLPGIFAIGYAAFGGHMHLDETAVVLVGTSVAIHHYFVDGSLYKLRNADVRRALFAHLPRAAP